MRDYLARSASLDKTAPNAGVPRRPASSGSTGMVQPENDDSGLSSSRCSARTASSRRSLHRVMEGLDHRRFAAAAAPAERLDRLLGPAERVGGGRAIAVLEERGAQPHQRPSVVREQLQRLAESRRPPQPHRRRPCARTRRHRARSSRTPARRAVRRRTRSRGRIRAALRPHRRAPAEPGRAASAAPWPDSAASGAPGDPGRSCPRAAWTRRDRACRARCAPCCLRSARTGNPGRARWPVRRPAAVPRPRRRGRAGTGCPSSRARARRRAGPPPAPRPIGRRSRAGTPASHALPPDRARARSPA